LSLGCLNTDTQCPGPFTQLEYCPIPSCDVATNCGDCVSRARPQGGGSCGWCTTYDGNNIGCRSSFDECNGATSTTVQMLYSCPVNAVIPSILWSVSTILGLGVGALVYVLVFNSDTRRQIQASYGLFVLSFLFYGASLFSVLLSIRVSNKLNRKCCTGYCFCIWFFGCFELTSVLAGVLTGAIMDA
jgi:hypothetical protein